MKILVIDADEPHRESVSQVLRDQGFEVIEAVDMGSGTALAVEQEPDLILSDAKMKRASAAEPSIGLSPIQELGFPFFWTIPDGEISMGSSGGDPEEAIRRSQEMFRIMMENMTELIALVDVRGNRLYNSPSYQRVLGYTAEELRTTWSLEQIHPDDRAKVIAAADNAKKTGRGQVIEYRMRHRDGSWRYLESHAGVIRNADGKIEHLLIVARDITERKRSEQERERMERQLLHAQKMESIGQLAAGIAHEINTPIQYIGDNTRFLEEAFRDLQQLLEIPAKLAEAAQKGPIPEELLKGIEKARKEADYEYLAEEIPKAIEQSLEGIHRVANIVKAMKGFSHPGTEEKTPVDLNKAIENTLTVARNEWKYVAEAVLELAPDLPPVPCQPGAFNQVILNLIVNAAHAIAERIGSGGLAGKGTITLRTHQIGDQVEVRVEDNGTGIPEKVRDRIFEPFFTTKEVGKGTGQGLAIAHGVIVDQHGGTIDVETEQNRGTAFIIRLPLRGFDAKGEGVMGAD